MYILGIDPTQMWDDSEDEIPEFKVGQLGADSDGNIYQFVRANGAFSVVGDVVVIDEVGDADLVGTTESAPEVGQGLPVAVAMSVLGDDDWGWVQRYGVTAAVNAVTGCELHTLLNTTGAPGRLDDDGTSSAEWIEGLTITAVAASNTAPGILNWPYVGATIPA